MSDSADLYSWTRGDEEVGEDGGDVLRRREEGREAISKKGRTFEGEGGALGPQLLTWRLGAPLQLREENLTEDLPLGPSVLGTFSPLDLDSAEYPTQDLSNLLELQPCRTRDFQVW